MKALPDVGSTTRRSIDESSTGPESRIESGRRAFKAATGRFTRRDSLVEGPYMGMGHRLVSRKGAPAQFRCRSVADVPRSGLLAELRPCCRARTAPSPRLAACLYQSVGRRLCRLINCAS